ncbi:MAG: cupin, partial [Paracoccaceae bacterium]
PAGSQITAKAGPEGAKIWVKSGHLSYAKAPAV